MSLNKTSYLSQININEDGTMVGKLTTIITEDNEIIARTIHIQNIPVADGVTPVSPEVTPFVKQMLDSVFYLRERNKKDTTVECGTQIINITTTTTGEEI